MPVQTVGSFSSVSHWNIWSTETVFEVYILIILRSWNFIVTYRISRHLPSRQSTGLISLHWWNINIIDKAGQCGWLYQTHTICMKGWVSLALCSFKCMNTYLDRLRHCVNLSIKSCTIHSVLQADLGFGLQQLAIGRNIPYIHMEITKIHFIYSWVFLK